MFTSMEKKAAFENSRMPITNMTNRSMLAPIKIFRFFDTSRTPDSTLSSSKIGDIIVSKTARGTSKDPNKIAS